MDTIFEKLRGVGNTKRRFVILGAGGIGSNVMRFLNKGPANYYRTYVHEFDTVELCNLNRTALFGMHHVGKMKVDAIRESLRTVSQEDHSVFYYRDRVNAESNLTPRDSGTASTPAPVIADCRDTIDPSLLPEKTWLKASYDGGTHISWHFLPAVTNRSIWRMESDGTYDVTPSFYVPAALSGLMVRLFSSFDQFVRLDPSKHSRAISLDIDEAILATATYTDEEEDDDDQ